MKAKSAKGKGRALENFIVQWLRNTKLDPSAIRTPGSGNGRFKGDIYTPNFPVVIECKNTKRPSLGEWIEQAQASTYGSQPWVLMWHPPMTPMEGTIVVLDLQLFEKLAKAYMRTDKTTT